MTDDKINPAIDTAVPNEESEIPTRKFEDLPAPAQRALLEAQARREANVKQAKDNPPEIGGRGGKDPARFGDWEVKGIAIDF